MSPAPSVSYDHSLFEDAPSSFTSRSVCMGIYGPTDSGRTTLAFTAPGPIAYIHTLEKKDGLIQKFNRLGKQIHPCPIDGKYNGTRDQVQLAANAAFTKVEKAIADAVKWARTIVFDTDTELWQVCQLARLGTLTRDTKSESDQKKGQLVYQEINARWLTLLKEYRRNAESPRNGVGTNLILISQEGPEYKGKEATGKMIRSCQKGVPAFCDVTIRTSKVKMLKTTFKGVIEKPWFNNEVRDLELEGELDDPDSLLSFPAIMELITEVDAEEWS